MSRHIYERFFKGYVSNTIMLFFNFKKTIRSSDLTLADYWGVKNKHLEFDNDKGVSLLLVNSKKGHYILSKIYNKIEILKTDLEYASSCDHCIVRSVKYNNRREKFFRDFKATNLQKIIEKYIKLSRKEKFRNKIYNILKRIK